MNADADGDGVVMIGGWGCHDCEPRAHIYPSGPCNRWRLVRSALYSAGHIELCPKWCITSEDGAWMWCLHNDGYIRLAAYDGLSSRAVATISERTHGKSVVSFLNGVVGGTEVVPTRGGLVWDVKKNNEARGCFARREHEILIQTA